MGLAVLNGVCVYATGDKQSENTVDWYEIVSDYSKGIAVHPEPDKDSDTLIRIQHGEVFPVYYYEDGTDYGYISYDGIEGYINLTYAQYLYTDGDYAELDFNPENYLSDGYYQYDELVDTLMNGFPGEYEYPDDNNEILKEAIKTLYSMELEHNPHPDMIWKGLSGSSHKDHFYVDNEQLDKLVRVNEVLTIEGLRDDACLSFFTYSVYCANCDEYISGIGRIYFQIGDGIIEYSYGDDVPEISDYMERKLSDYSLICDQVNKWQLLDVWVNTSSTSETYSEDLESDDTYSLEEEEMFDDLTSQRWVAYDAEDYYSGEPIVINDPLLFANQITRVNDLQFDSDGTFTMNYSNAVAMSGTYEIQGNQVVLHSDSSSEQIVMRYGDWSYRGWDPMKALIWEWENDHGCYYVYSIHPSFYGGE